MGIYLFAVTQMCRVERAGVYRGPQGCAVGQAHAHKGFYHVGMQAFHHALDAVGQAHGRFLGAQHDAFGVNPHAQNLVFVHFKQGGCLPF